MTKAFMTFIFLIFLRNWTLAQSSPNTAIILDSLEVLKNVGGFFDGITYPPTDEEIRYDNISQLLYELPLTEAKNLISDNNKFARTYGFTILCKRYFDNLTKSDLEIFKDTTILPIFTQRGILDFGTTVGNYCEMAYSSTLNSNKNLIKEKDVILSIKQFIKDNSQYPSSYIPIEFTNYTWGGNEDELIFEIQHKYNLKKSNGQEVEVTNYFILDNQLQIMLIESSRSNTIKVDPPILDEWKSKFGKIK
jgi:hypothetical protein